MNEIENESESFYFNNNSNGFVNESCINQTNFQEETNIDTTIENSFRNEISEISTHLHQQEQPLSIELIMNKENESIKKYFERIEKKKKNFKEKKSKVTESYKQNSPSDNLKPQDLNRYFYLKAKKNSSFERTALLLSCIDKREKQSCRICEKSPSDIFFGCQTCKRQNYFLCQSCFNLICSRNLHSPNHCFKIYKLSESNENTYKKIESNNNDYSWKLLEEIKEIVVETGPGKTEEIIAPHIHLQNVGEKPFYGFDFDLQNSDFTEAIPELKEVKPGDVYDNNLKLVKLSLEKVELGHFKIILMVRDKRGKKTGKPLIIKLKIVQKDLEIN